MYRTLIAFAFVFSACNRAVGVGVDPNLGAPPSPPVHASQAKTLPSGVFAFEAPDGGTPEDLLPQVPGDMAEPVVCGMVSQACCETDPACTGDLICEAGVCVAITPCGGLGQACCGGPVDPCPGLVCVNQEICQEAACGALGEPCCQGTTCDIGACTDGTCQLPPPCGAFGQTCCAASPACDGELVCINGSCETLPPPACGSAGQACCDTGCTAGLVCFAGLCQVNRPTCEEGFAYTDCALTQGYYRTHACWPLSYLNLGTVVYNAVQLNQILGQEPNGNGLVSLAHQLIAAKLNVADGAKAPAAIAEGDVAIGSLVVPPVGSDYLDPIPLVDLISTLDSFNMGKLDAVHCN